MSGMTAADQMLKELEKACTSQATGSVTLQAIPGMALPCQDHLLRPGHHAQVGLPAGTVPLADASGSLSSTMPATTADALLAPGVGLQGDAQHVLPSSMPPAAVITNGVAGVSLAGDVPGLLQSVAPSSVPGNHLIGVGFPSDGSNATPGTLPGVAPTSAVASTLNLGGGLAGNPPNLLAGIPTPAELLVTAPAVSLPVSGLCKGTLFHIAEGGTYGFIKPDIGGADIFTIPSLSGFPPAGSRVTCNLVPDHNLPGKVRAENVQPDTGVIVASQPPSSQSLSAIDINTTSLANISHLLVQPQQPAPAVATVAPTSDAQSVLAATLAATDPVAQAALTAASDPGVVAGLATLLAAADPTVQAVLAQQLVAGAALQGLPSVQNVASTGDAAPVVTNGPQTGTIRHIQNGGKFGFIKPDNGGPDILALPPRTGFPAIGARVTFETCMDDKSGRPKADNVQVVDESIQFLLGFGPHPLDPAAAALRSAPFPGGATARHQGPVTQPSDIVHQGTISKVNEKFAFIKQDSGEADMFVIPPACEAFGRELPPVGTRVQYKVIMDSKSGRPRADCVGPSLGPSLM